MVGPCKGHFPSFSWDGETCRSFIYGGCHGTRNRFWTKEECLKECRGKPKPGGGDKPGGNNASAGVTETTPTPGGGDTPGGDNVSASVTETTRAPGGGPDKPTPEEGDKLTGKGDNY